MIRLLDALVLGICIYFAFFYYTDAPYQFIVVFLCSGLYTLLRSRYNINIASLVCILLVCKAIEWLIQPYIADQSNYIIAGSLSFIDISVILLILFRPALVRAVGTFSFEEEVKPTIADQLVAFIYMLYLLINVAFFFEHALRHLEHFGLSEDSPTTIYWYETARVVWHIYTPVKHTLNIFEFIVLWSVLLTFMSKPRNSLLEV